jgi:hypothetical protein
MDELNYSRFQSKRLNEKNIQMLYGILQGLVADNEINDEEIHFLYNWFCDFNYKTVMANDSDYEFQNPHFGHFERKIANKVSDILEDGIITSLEKESLLKVIQDYLGGSPDEGIVGGQVINVPLDKDAVLTSSDVFCFTGTMLGGTRKEWTERLSALNIACTKAVLVSTTVLVIGVEPSRDWINTSYGRKIESVINMKEKGRDIKIINQEMLESFIANLA